MYVVQTPFHEPSIKKRNSYSETFKCSLREIVQYGIGNHFAWTLVYNMLNCLHWLLKNLRTCLWRCMCRSCLSWRLRPGRTTTSPQRCRPTAPGASCPRSPTNESGSIIIIIINIIRVWFWQATLRLFRSSRFAKEEGTIQYGYSKLETHARVFSQTLGHGNSKNEIRQRNRIRR